MPYELAYLLSEETYREINTVRAQLSVMCHLSSPNHRNDMPTEDLVTTLYDLEERLGRILVQIRQK